MGGGHGLFGPYIPLPLRRGISVVHQLQTPRFNRAFSKPKNVTLSTGHTLNKKSLIIDYHLFNRTCVNPYYINAGSIRLAKILLCYLY